MSKEQMALLRDFVKKYEDNVHAGFDGRWSSITPGIYNRRMHECIGGLLSRQATLTIGMARAPETWTVHIAPLILRCMIDAYITLAWILDEPIERSEKYVKYGLGQEKLYIEYLREGLQEDPDFYEGTLLAETIEIRKSWLNSQLAEWATEVNVGSMSGISARQMAMDIGRESIYKHAYVPFSGAVHNMWQHVGNFNVEPCKNPLHKWHLVPKVRDFFPEPDFMYRSAKYMSISFEKFDEKMEAACDVILPQEFFERHPLFNADDEDEA